MLKKLPIYKITRDGMDGITKMSLVEFPAVESDFLKFAEQESLKFSIDEEEHIVFGCALRCDFPIYRCDRKGEYYVVFDKDNIQDLYQKFMYDKRGSEVNLEHNTDVDDVYLIQSFIKNTEKGLNPKGYENVSDGSWFVAYKVDNEDVWNEVKNGEYKGFSVECIAALDFEGDEPEDEIEQMINDIINNK